MWVFLNNAFVSAVEHNGDPSLLVVRARIEGDLERFLGDFANLYEVERHEDRDYLFRTVISKQEFRTLLSYHVDAIDYGNFKDSIVDDDNERHMAYLQVWNVMNNLQDRVHHAGRYCYSSRLKLGHKARS